MEGAMLRAGVRDPEMEWLNYLTGLDRYLESRILGQSHAIARMVKALQAAELGLNKVTCRPRSSFLFLGPTGVGKTESAKAFTDYLFGSAAAMEMLYMNEYASDARIQEFLQRLELAVQRNPGGTTLLFDEIEKAHSRLIDLFLSILEEGEFTALSGERFRVSRFYLVFTSNLGSGDLAKMENAPYSTMERVALEVARETFRPELFARITERIVFKPLGLDVQKIIIEKLVELKLKVLSKFFGSVLSFDKGPVLALLLRLGYNKTQGARMLQQEVDRQFNQASLPWALSKQMPTEGRFYCDPSHGSIVLR